MIRALCTNGRLSFTNNLSHDCRAARLLRSCALSTLLSSAWSTWRLNASNPVMRRNVAWLMTGKMLGLLAVVAFVQDDSDRSVLNAIMADVAEPKANP